MREYLIELPDGEQNIIEAENYETALKMACEWADVIVSDVTNIK